MLNRELFIRLSFFAVLFDPRLFDVGVALVFVIGTGGGPFGSSSPFRCILFSILRQLMATAINQNPHKITQHVFYTNPSFDLFSLMNYFEWCYYGDAQKEIENKE